MPSSKRPPQPSAKPSTEEADDNAREGQPLVEIFQATLEESSLWNHKEIRFQARLHPGFERLVFLTGPNATGKSLLARIVQALGKAHFGTTPIIVSMTERTGSGAYEMSGLRRSMMFGDESEQSTGATSVDIVDKAFRNAASRAQEDGKRVLLVLDEPEIGLSEGYEYALGQVIGQKTLELPERACGALVISHSRALAEGLQNALGRTPSFACTGTQDFDFEDWLTHQERFSAEALLQLRELEQEGRRAVMAAERALLKKP